MVETAVRMIPISLLLAGLAPPAAAQGLPAATAPVLLGAKTALDGCLGIQAHQGTYYPADLGQSALSLLQTCPDQVNRYRIACNNVGIPDGQCETQLAVISEHALDQAGL